MSFMVFKVLSWLLLAHLVLGDTGGNTTTGNDCGWLWDCSLNGTDNEHGVPQCGWKWYCALIPNDANTTTVPPPTGTEGDCGWRLLCLTNENSSLTNTDDMDCEWHWYCAATSGDGGIDNSTGGGDDNCWKLHCGESTNTNNTNECEWRYHCNVGEADSPTNITGVSCGLRLHCPSSSSNITTLPQSTEHNDTTEDTTQNDCEWARVCASSTITPPTSSSSSTGSSQGDLSSSTGPVIGGANSSTGSTDVGEASSSTGQIGGDSSSTGQIGGDSSSTGQIDGDSSSTGQIGGSTGQTGEQPGKNITDPICAWRWKCTEGNTVDGANVDCPWIWHCPSTLDDPPVTPPVDAPDHCGWRWLCGGASGNSTEPPHVPAETNTTDSSCDFDWYCGASENPPTNGTDSSSTGGPDGSSGIIGESSSGFFNESINAAMPAHSGLSLIVAAAPVFVMGFFF